MLGNIGYVFHYITLLCWYNRCARYLLPVFTDLQILEPNIVAAMLT
jgi:hypothetical protein